MDIIYAIFYGITQGLTEFLPVSSSGHLVLLHSFLGHVITDPIVFDVILHFGSLLAIVVYFRKDLVRISIAFFRLLWRLPISRDDSILLIGLIVATLPGGIAGIFFEDVISTLLRSPASVAIVLVLGSLYLFFAERVLKKYAKDTSLTVSKAIVIGCAQVLALAPGFSRSGATIGAGMMLGFTREYAARFSFLLALPIILGATGKVIFDYLHTGHAVTSIEVFIAGGVASFMSAIFVIHFLLGYVRKHSLYPFIWYRIGLAIIILGIYFLGNI